MPIYESWCTNEKCTKYQDPVERYYPRSDTPLKPCEACGSESRRLLSRFGIVFTGVLSGTKYKEKGMDDYGQDGHWVWTKKTPDGKPKPVFIETFDQQRDFCKQEGLVNPKDIGPVEGGSDGKKSSSQGLPGCWY
jgi:predicted nucleic acid-binding Zn ribbon protein